MNQHSQPPKRQSNFSATDRSRILEASRGRTMGLVQEDEIIDSLDRIMKNYVLTADAEVLYAIVKAIRKDFYFLTLNELELAYELANKSITGNIYFAQKLTLQFNFKVLDAYKTESASVKFANRPVTSSQESGEDCLNRFLKFVRFYRKLPVSCNNLRALQYIIESKQISKPDDWDSLHYAEQDKAADHYLLWYLKNFHPDIELAPTVEA